MKRLLGICLVWLVAVNVLMAQTPTPGVREGNPPSQGYSPSAPLQASPNITLAQQPDAPPSPPPEPVPSYRIPVPAHGYVGTPPLPPYAWPTYAPYNNYSRVAYPNCYPYEAFPYFGPFYPFPKVPLGWRAVKLEWNDGFWFLSTHAQRYDYWVLRFW